MEICPFSGLPFTCALCPEDDAPCYEKTHLKTQDDKKLAYSVYVSDYLLGRNLLKREDKSFNEYLREYF